MRTPREVLLARHRRAEPRLDAVRREALGRLAASVAQVSKPAVSQASKPAGLTQRQPSWKSAIQQVWKPALRTGGRWLIAGLSRLWRELVWPYRRAWAGLAVLWLGLLAAQVELRGPAAGVASGRSIPSAEVLQSLQEQRRVLAQLLQPAPLSPAEPPRRVPGPRSVRAPATELS